MARRAAEAALALLVAAVALGLQCASHFEALRSYRVPALPAFDAYVYVAMAEHPRVFTVAPWGHRILAPWIAHALSAQDLTAAFRVVTLASFALAAALLFAFLRRLGHRPAAAALGAGAFLLSPPVGELVAAPFLADPLACACLVGFLLAVEMDAGLGVLVLVAVMGTLAKEVLVLFLPVAFFARRHRSGRRAALETAVVASCALAAAILLRAVWTPGIRTPLPDLGPERFRLIVASVWAEPGRWLGVLGLGGLVPVAIAGALRSRAHEYRRRYGWVFVATLAQPLLAHYAIQQVVGEMNRYLLYAVPAVVPLGLVALDAVIPNLGPPAGPRPGPAWLSRAAAAAAAIMVAIPLATVDRYRRLDIQGRRDGLYVLGFCRGTLTTARKLGDGAAVVLRMEERRFAPQGFEPGMLDRMRWFLRDGWGPEPYYGTDEVLMQEDRATLVLPCLTPAPIELTLALSAAQASPVSVSVNGHALGADVVGVERTRLRFDVPAAALFRGDNVVALEAGEARGGGLRLYAVTYSPAARANAASTASNTRVAISRLTPSRTAPQGTVRVSPPAR